MYLKSIELQGFKSFTDKTMIKLDGGISCIVGPNGSGKSNISDAIRWVLGEQSARNLRGNKMQDVIFSGSDSRKALGMAQVTLHIDNSDGKLPLEFTDVEVCRRAYRSGDSEYLINGQQCRLKDIQELFLDSGVSNNSLAMVGQGRVQQIVDMKPEERRALIEEAAGVIKYRNRKKSAVRRLADTESNLARVWDIISELAGRLEPLAEQKEKAERYLELKAEADAKEINLLLQILDENKELIDKIKVEVASRQDALIKAETDFNIVNVENETIKAELAELEANAGTAQQELFALRTEKERADAKATLLQERVSVAADNIKRLEDEIALLLSRDDGFVMQVQQLEADSAAKAEARDLLAASLKAMEAAYQEKRQQIEELDATCELTRDELFDLANELTGCRNQLTYQAQTLTENKNRRLGLEAAKKELSEGRSGLEIEKERLQKELDELKAKITAGKQKRQEIAARLDAINNDKVHIAEQEVNTRLQLNGLQSRLKVLQEFAENLEGFHPGVRALLKAKKQKLPIGSRIVGSVVDLIDIDAKYTTAIEAALAAGLQNLVVQNADDAKAAVEYLKKEQLGRATFLPIDDLVIKPHPVMEKSLGQPGVIGRCADVVKCDPAHRVVIEYLLNNILLVDNLDTAVKIARQSKHSFKIITLDADLIRTGGAITGGSQAKNSGDLLKKRTQLKALENQVKDLAAAQNGYQQQLTELREQEISLDAERSEIDKLLKTGDIDIVTLSKDLEHLDSRLSGQESQVRMYDNEIAMLLEEEEHLIARGKELENQIANWQNLNDESNRKLAELQNLLQTSRAELESAAQSISEKNSELAAAEQICMNFKAEVARLRQEKSSLFAREADLKRDLADWQQQALDITAQQEDNKNAILQLAGSILEAEEILGTANDALNQSKNRIDELTSASYRLNRDININRQELHQLELKETRLQTEWDNESVKLAEAFHMTYEEALPYLDKEFSRRELQKSVRALRVEISDLGNVNVDAIEEYTQVFERHSFLTSQRQDLLDARDSLNKVIREMDAIMVKRFSEAFNAVNEHFDRTFCKLFGGGSAGLVMTDPEDVLETGIEIIVRPPGKKVVNYNLLSGGEKSLIGISLILAVFQVNPSPLCVLDEVDAALDEANVDRFGQYLQEFKDKTQFIVVSHRQGTMEAAGSLWGVTMAADGVSKLVSVKLSDVTEITDMPA